MAFVYSCCFWFSLRLGGILIGVFSVGHAVITLTVVCLAYKNVENVKYEVSELIKNINLLFINNLLENFMTDPVPYLSYFICVYSIYILTCFFYIYGAYMCNNSLMFLFIFVEFIRVITLSIIATTLLLILKQNTMDIGLLIAASVASGFFLLGMFYLWVCAANLPILINEMERDEQKATIAKLQRLLETKNQRASHEKYVNFDDENFNPRKPFLIPVTTHNNFIKKPYYSSFIH